MWPREAVEFLQELEDNNDTEWFRANRRRYDDSLVAPARVLTEELSHLGEAHFLRPYNNRRFRPGPPLKEHLGVAIGYGFGGAYYFDLSLDGLLVGAGLHHPAPDQLERFRAAIDDRRRSSGFERAILSAEEAGLSLTPPGLKRAPRGYSNDHPRLGYLRLKSITVSRRHPLGRWLHTRRCDELVRSELEGAEPLVRWLRKVVGRSELPRRALAER